MTTTYETKCVDGVTVPHASLDQTIEMLTRFLQTIGGILEKAPADTHYIHVAALAGNSLEYLRLFDEHMRRFEEARNEVLLDETPAMGGVQ